MSTSGPTGQAQAFRQMFPEGVATSVWKGDGVPELFPAELETVRKAVATRRDEFARGRACARGALGQLGVEPDGVPVGEGRAPVWPAGIVGSITHTSGFVGAAVARAARFPGLGVDVERARPLEPAIRKVVLTPDEIGATALPEWDILVFSAKESVHKAVFPITGVFLDFLDVSIVPDPSEATFRVEARTPKGTSVPVLPRLQGVYRVVPPFVMTAIWLDPTSS